MIINIISIIIGMIIYNVGKKFIEIYIIKKNKKNLQKIIDNFVENSKIDNNWWEE